MYKITILFSLLVLLFSCKKTDTNPNTSSNSTVNNNTNNNNNTSKNTIDTCWLNYEKVDAACVEIDKNDVKWFAGTGGLYSFENEKWNNFQNSLRIFNRLVINPFNLEKNVFYSGARGLHCFNGKTWNYKDSSNNEALTIFSAEYDNSGNLWITHQHQDWKRSTYLFIYNNSLVEIDLSSYIGFLGSTFIKCNNNFLWIGSYNGLLKFDITQNKVIETYNQTNSSICSNQIVDMVFDNLGNLWLASADGGVSKYDGKIWENFNSVNSGLIHNLTTSIAVDKYNNIWVGTIMGLSKYNNSNWTNYTPLNSKILDSEILDIAVDKQDNKWIVTKKGVSRLSKTK
jgi:ligand-binding sensor domain-containing protein